jgi:invasion protein IalB
MNEPKHTIGKCCHHAPEEHRFLTLVTKLLLKEIKEKQALLLLLPHGVLGGNQARLQIDKGQGTRLACSSL